MDPGDVLEYAGRWASSEDLVATVVAHGGAGPAGEGRLESLRRLLRSRSGGDEVPTGSI